MNYFLNFDVNNGLQVKTSRNANAEVCGNIGEFMDNVKHEINSVITLDKEVKECLESGTYWNGSNIDANHIDEVHWRISRFI